MPDDIGFNPHTSPIYTGTNPFADDWHPQESTPHYGNQSHQGPEGLEGRPPSMGGMPPRQHFGMPAGGGGNPPMPPVDDATMHAIMMQRQQTVNNTALAEATAEAQGAQGLNEFLKSMAEMQAKSIKSAGEKLAGLA
jgi:hypothetical protein